MKIEKLVVICYCHDSFPHRAAPIIFAVSGPSARATMPPFMYGDRVRSSAPVYVLCTRNVPLCGRVYKIIILTRVRFGTLCFSGRIPQTNNVVRTVVTFYKRRAKRFSRPSHYKRGNDDEVRRGKTEKRKNGTERVYMRSHLSALLF